MRKLKARGWSGGLNESYTKLVLKFKAAEIVAVSDETMTVISSYIRTLQKVANPQFFHALAYNMQTRSFCPLMEGNGQNYTWCLHRVYQDPIGPFFGFGLVLRFSAVEFSWRSNAHTLLKPGMIFFFLLTLSGTHSLTLTHTHTHTHTLPSVPFRSIHSLPSLSCWFMPPLPSPLHELLSRTKVLFTFERPISSIGLIHQSCLGAHWPLQQKQREGYTNYWESMKGQYH